MRHPRSSGFEANTRSQSCQLGKKRTNWGRSTDGLAAVRIARIWLTAGLEVALEQDSQDPSQACLRGPVVVQVGLGQLDDESEARYSPVEEKEVQHTVLKPATLKLKGLPGDLLGLL